MIYFDFLRSITIYRVSTKKLILAGLGVSRTIYVNVDSPNLGFPYFFHTLYKLKSTSVPKWGGGGVDQAKFGIAKI